MLFSFTMPKLTPTMEQGVIAKWHKKPGDFVEAGELLLEVSTDKATVEHNAIDAGFLRKILVEEGKEAAVNAPIALFSTEKEESIEGFQVIAPSIKKEEKAIPKLQPTATLRHVSSGRVAASPLAKKIAQQQGVDLTTIKGSGPRGRIVSKDLEAALKMPEGNYTEISLSPIRKVISKRLQEAKATIPHFYVDMEVNAEPLVAFREQLKEKGIRVSINDCIIKATALTLQKHPNVNSGFFERKSSILQFNTIDISVAVSIPEGLITPIVFKADEKSIEEISKEVRSLSERAKEGKLHPQEFQGGSFTISNLGMYGVTSFQAIINPPQAAILAVGSILERPVVRGGKVLPGKILNLSLSADHRVVDGVAAAKFLTDLRSVLESLEGMSG